MNQMLALKLLKKLKPQKPDQTLAEWLEANLDALAAIADAVSSN
jgi:hypothetical protein